MRQVLCPGGTKEGSQGFRSPLAAVRFTFSYLPLLLRSNQSHFELHPNGKGMSPNVDLHEKEGGFTLSVSFHNIFNFAQGVIPEHIMHISGEKMSKGGPIQPFQDSRFPRHIECHGRNDGYSPVPGFFLQWPSEGHRE